MKTNRISVLKINAAAAIFCALAYVSEFVFHVKVTFLTFDIKDSIIAIASMILGPIYAVVMGVVVSLLELFTMSDTGLYGFLMNVLSTVTFTAIAALIYKYKRTLYGAVLGFVSGALAMTAVMVLANLLITPYYMGVDRSQVVAMIPKLFLPFNLLKALFNASIAMLLYKHVVTVLRRAHVLPPKIVTDNTVNTVSATSDDVGDARKTRVGKTVAVTAGAVAVGVLSIVVLVVVLGAKIEWF